MSTLKDQAEALGITVPGNWGDKRIQEEIEKIQKPALDPGQASTTQAAPIVPNNAPPPAVSGITPGPSPTSIIEEPKPKAKEKAKEKTIEVRLKFDYWPEDGERKSAGEVVEVPMRKAKQLISQGKAEIPLDEDD